MTKSTSNGHSNTQFFVHDELMDAEQKVASYRFCCPIFITGMYGTALANDIRLVSTDGTNPEIRSGTLTFVSYSGQIYGITCRHVVDALEGKNLERRQEHTSLYGDAVPFVAEAQMHFFFPKGNQQIHINSKFYKASGDAFTASYPDVAIARISRQKMAQIGREFIALENEVPPSNRWSSAACGIATGYPEQNRRCVPSDGLVSTLGISTVVAISPFEPVSDTQLTMFCELIEEPEADNLSGMSGGPILWSDESGWGLIGIVKKGRDMKPSSTMNGQSFLTGHNIWIDGERITKSLFKQWVAQIPENDQPVKDLTKILYVPKGHA